MSWTSYIFPQRVAKLSSLYNKEIRINEEKGKLNLLVNGSKQSGAYVEMLWKEACKKFQIPQGFTPQKILVLGVAGGTVIRLLHRYYPNASIVGVDIDKIMIDVGKRYFGLDTINELTFICQDAGLFVKKKLKKFDLIVVDLFVGTHIPEFVRSEMFLQNIKALVTKSGVVVINYLREFEYLAKSEILKGTLVKLFHNVAEKAIYSNRFFFVRRS